MFLGVGSSLKHVMKISGGHRVLCVDVTDDVASVCFTDEEDSFDKAVYYE